MRPKEWDDVFKLLEEYWASPEGVEVAALLKAETDAGAIALFDSGYLAEQEIGPWGHAPVQLELQLETGEFIYFRSRGTTRLEIWKSKEDFHSYFQSSPPAAEPIEIFHSHEGYMNHKQSGEQVVKWLKEYYEHE